MKTKIWDVIKNFFIVVGGIWVFIQLYNFFDSKRSKLNVLVDESEYPVFRFFEPALIDAEKRYELLIKKSIHDSVNQVKLIDSARSLVNEERFFHDRSKPKKLISFKLENDSNQDLPGVKIIAKESIEFFYEYYYGGNNYYGKSSKIVSIINLSPADKLNVYILCSSYEDAQDFTVVHSGGNAKIQYYSKLIGFSAMIGNFFAGPYTSILIIWIIGIIVIVLVAKFTTQKSINKSSSESTTEVLNQD